jgi:hypothetical protein
MVIALALTLLIVSVAPVSLYLNDRSRRDDWTFDKALYLILGIRSI